MNLTLPSLSTTSHCCAVLLNSIWLARGDFQVAKFM